jgi:hypothetical protein
MSAIAGLRRRSGANFTALVLGIGLLWTAAAGAQNKSGAPEDLGPCAGSAPEPAQSAAWPVAFCNRTAHDILVEFHDNECPLQSWGRRGRVYERIIRRGASMTLPLCYVNLASQAAAPRPGEPALRIPGGRGVLTTWSVVGDCGETSDHVTLDLRSFYDRGDYKTGIILLQYPASSSHCQAAATATNLPPVPLPPPAGAAANSHSAPGSASAPPVAPVVTSAPRATLVRKEPTLSALKDPDDRLGRTARIFATTDQDAATLKCRLTLNLGFTDGSDFVDHATAEVSAGLTNTLVVTRRYGKTLAKLALSASKCETR